MYKLQSKLVKTYDAVIKIIETIEFTSIDKSIWLLRWKTFCFVNVLLSSACYVSSPTSRVV